MNSVIRKNLIGPEIRKLRKARGWSQSDLATNLRNVGLRITSNDVAKIEAQLVVIPDYELLFFTQLFEVTQTSLFPKLDQRQSLKATLNKLITGKRCRLSDFRSAPHRRKYRVIAI